MIAAIYARKSTDQNFRGSIRKTVLLSWIVWSVVDSSGLVGGTARAGPRDKAWTMGLATETKAECEAAMAAVVRQIQEGAAAQATTGTSVQNLPNGVRLQGPRTSIEHRAECWPAGADPRGTR
jgi:hypothetical protein